MQELALLYKYLKYLNGVYFFLILNDFPNSLSAPTSSKHVA